MVQFRVPCGEAVGVIGKAAALRLLLRYHVTVERVEHGGCGGRFRLFPLAEYPEQSLALRFLRLFLRTLPCDDRHTLGNPFIDVLLLVKHTHDAAQLLLLVFQQPPHAVDTLRRVDVFEAAEQAVHRLPLVPVFLHVRLLPFQYGLAEQGEFHHTYIHVMNLHTQGVYPVVLRLERLQLPPLADP